MTRNKPNAVRFCLAQFLSGGDGNQAVTKLVRVDQPRPRSITVKAVLFDGLSDVHSQLRLRLPELSK